MLNIFTYGSLMFSDVFSGVTLCLPTCLPAHANGWRRWALKQRTYPGALPDTNSKIEGVLWLDVPHEAITRLDQFEGDEYERVGVVVRTANGVAHQAAIYHWLLPDQVEGDWNVDTFDNMHRSNFVAQHGTK